MAAAVFTEISVTSDVIEIADGPNFTLKRGIGSLGSRVVGATTILGAATLLILLGLAFFATRINERHVELTNLQDEIDEVQQSISVLELQNQNTKTPIEIERLADGYLAMTKADSSTQIQVQSEHLAIGSPIWTPPSTGLTSTNFVGVDPLLASATASASPSNGR
tara:strand:+ start:1709 stop:2203 length:495 start_codon:yes stop_codon:yes gene_type:complete